MKTTSIRHSTIKNLVCVLFAPLLLPLCGHRKMKSPKLIVLCLLLLPPFSPVSNSLKTPLRRDVLKIKKPKRFHSGFFTSFHEPCGVHQAMIAATKLVAKVIK